MNYYNEVLDRIAERIRIEDDLSDAAYKEMLEHLADDPRQYVRNNEDASYLCLAEGIELYRQYLSMMAGEASLDNDQFNISIENVESAEALLKQACAMSLAINPNNIDAQYLELMHRNDGLGTENLVRVKELVEKYRDKLDPIPSVFTRPFQRLHAAYINALMQNAAYMLVIEEGDKALQYDISDPFDVRHCLSLSLARLEDMPAFEELEETFDRKANCWSYLARIILLYRINNLTAAKRAITGYTKIVPGAAHLLLAGKHQFPIPKQL